MLQYLKGYTGKLKVNGVQYNTVQEAQAALKGYKGTVTVLLGENRLQSSTGPKTGTLDKEAVYRIEVKAYMTKPSSVDFDFHKKWNNDVPMPMRIMEGRKLEETKGMVKMELQGCELGDTESHCFVCGRKLTNDVSRVLGVGPECGGHGYTNPFETDAELTEAVQAIQAQLRDTKWTGWVIKSAIKKEVKVREHA